MPGGAEIAVFCNFAGIAKTLKKQLVFIGFWGVGEVSELIFEVLEPLFGLAGSTSPASWLAGTPGWERIWSC